MRETDCTGYYSTVSQPHSAFSKQTQSNRHECLAETLEEPPIYMRHLHSEVSAGLALLDLAQTVHALPVASQCCLHAQQIYDTALRFLEQVVLSDAERAELIEKLASLETRLTHLDAP